MAGNGLLLRLQWTLLLLGCLDTPAQAIAALSPFAAAGATAANTTMIGAEADLHNHPDVHAGCDAALDAYFSRFARNPSPYMGNMAFFLHLPRTAGRTFHTCFLKLGTPPHRRCPKAYDHLRINTSVPNCYLLSSHDDYSVLSLLPDDVAVLSHFRDPVDRFLSAYEFAVEIAARRLTSRPPQGGSADKTVTENVWPWSYLMPFITQDMRLRSDVSVAGGDGGFGAAETKTRGVVSRGVRRRALGARADAWALVRHPDGSKYYYNAAQGVSKWHLNGDESELLLPALNPYDNPLAMSLEEFVEHPIARELLHDGQTYQVLGITNYSHWADAAQLRQCMEHSPSAREQLLQLALNRTQAFMHVGTTDKLADSVAAAGAALGFDLEAAAYPASSEPKNAADKQREQQHLQQAVLGAEQRLNHAAHRLRDLQRRQDRLRDRDEGDAGTAVADVSLDEPDSSQDSSSEIGDRSSDKLSLVEDRIQAAKISLYRAQGALRAAKARAQSWLRHGRVRHDQLTGTERHEPQVLQEGSGKHATHDAEVEGAGARGLLEADQQQPEGEAKGQALGQGSSAQHEQPAPQRQAGKGSQALRDGSGDAFVATADARDGLGFDSKEQTGSSSGAVSNTQPSSTTAGAQRTSVPRPTPPSLGTEYQHCAQRAQQRSGQRRVRSLSRWTLPDGRSIWFSKAQRQAIPERILDRIRQLNQLDSALYQQAQQQAQQQRAQWAADGRLQELPPQPVPGPDAVKAEQDTNERLPFHIPKPPPEGKEEL